MNTLLDEIFKETLNGSSYNQPQSPNNQQEMDYENFMEWARRVGQNTLNKKVIPITTSLVTLWNSIVSPPPPKTLDPNPPPPIEAPAPKKPHIPYPSEPNTKDIRTIEQERKKKEEEERKKNNKLPKKANVQKEFSYERPLVHEVFREAEDELRNTHFYYEYYPHEFEGSDDEPSTRRDGTAATAQDKNKEKWPAPKPPGTNNPRGGLTPAPDGPRDAGADPEAKTRREGSGAMANRQSNFTGSNSRMQSQGKKPVNQRSGWPSKKRELEMSVMQEIFMEAEGEINNINTLFNNGYDTREYVLSDNGGHSSNKEPSNLPKHEKGNARRGRDQGGEKGDENRQVHRKRPDNWKGSWPPKNSKFKM